MAACFSLCSVSPRSPTGATYMACAPSADAMCRAQDYSVHGLLAQLIQLHTISGLIGVVAATGAMYLIGTAAEPTSRVFGLISIGCGLGVAVIGLLDIPLLLTNSVIGLGERGRILLISIWLAALGMQLLVHNILPLRLRRHRWWRRAGATSLVSSGWRWATNDAQPKIGVISCHRVCAVPNRPSSAAPNVATRVGRSRALRPWGAVRGSGACVSK